MACLKSGQLCLEIGVLSSSFTEVLSETVSTTKRHSESCRVSLFVLLVVARVGQSVRSGVRAVLRSCGDSSLTVAEFVCKLSGYRPSCHIRPSAIQQMADSQEWPKPAVFRSSCGNSLVSTHRSLWQNLSVNCQGLPAFLPFGWPAAPHFQPPKVCRAYPPVSSGVVFRAVFPSWFPVFEPFFWLVWSLPAQLERG